jgi:hypothetical protein
MFWCKYCCVHLGLGLADDLPSRRAKARAEAVTRFSMTPFHDVMK